MPRKARQDVIAKNVIYHIISRGNNQQKIFKNVRDYKKFLMIIANVKKEIPFLLFSFCLMPNHYHLEIESLDAPISKIMHRINFLYVMYFHRRYNTSGHLFQDRFYSGVIDKESYFWAAARYIETNPVRAGLVKKPEDYRWSSFQSYFQKNYNQYLVNHKEFLSYYDENFEKSRLAYLEFVSESVKSGQDLKYDSNLIDDD